MHCSLVTPTFHRAFKQWRRKFHQAMKFFELFSLKYFLLDYYPHTHTLSLSSPSLSFFLYLYSSHKYTEYLFPLKGLFSLVLGGQCLVGLVHDGFHLCANLLLADSTSRRGRSGRGAGRSAFFQTFFSSRVNSLDGEGESTCNRCSLRS